MRSIILSLVLATALAPSAVAQGRAATPAIIETVTLHRIHTERYSCGEHAEGELDYVGDALGADCVINAGPTDDETGGFFRPFRTDGATNEDWFGWNAAVLAPFDGTVIGLHINPVTNRPGQLGAPPASFIVFERSDGVRVIFAHVQDIQVREGDPIRAGQVVARVGNNGYARNPHIHIGAWKGQTPYQIRWDLHRTPSS